MSVKKVFDDFAFCISFLFYFGVLFKFCCLGMCLLMNVNKKCFLHFSSFSFHSSYLPVPPINREHSRHTATRWLRDSGLIIRALTSLSIAGTVNSIFETKLHKSHCSLGSQEYSQAESTKAVPVKLKSKLTPRQEGYYEILIVPSLSLPCQVI